MILPAPRLDIPARLRRLSAAVALAALGTGSPVSAQVAADSIAPDTVVALPELTVPIGRLRVGAVPLSRTPFPVQSVAGTVGSAGDLAGTLARLPGVTLGSQTGSPQQPDLRIRGFAVSPVVGLPQSVSVFVDGVRVNEADASQVHLSLVPTHAIERVELLRGPVGAFGKNALAGALNIVTGRHSGPATLEVEAEGGSFGSGAGTLRAGEGAGPLDAFVAAAYRRESGWRALESADERSLFAKVGWRGARSDAWISYSFESDSLGGPGPLPESWISGGALPSDITSPPADRRRLQYTGGGGDAFVARVHFLNGRLERELGETSSAQVTSFARFADFRQSNDNITEPDALGLTDIASFGATVQVTHHPSDRIVLVGGAEAVRNRVDIDIRELPNAAFPSIVPATTERLRTDEDNLALFAEGWWSLTPRLALHASARYDHTSLPVTDLLDPGDSGANTFGELSGGLGVSGELGPGLSTFAGYGRGFRAPVILEVSCADPADPCQLPFELGPDPPLEPVRSDTWQAGLRLARASARAELVGYWSEVHDDIFNVVDMETPTRGYFTNLARTRRRGAELLVEVAPASALPGLTFSGTLALTSATFESEAVLSAPFVDDDGGSGQAEDDLEPPEVAPGDRFPMVPAVALTLGVTYAAGPTAVRLDVQRTGSQHLVGDESNEAPFGRLGAYTLVNVALEHRIGRVTAFASVSNALDADHARFGIISRNVRAADEVVERFLTPGRPRALRVGVRVRAGE